jgi:hypothetical protein
MRKKYWLALLFTLVHSTLMAETPAKPTGFTLAATSVSDFSVPAGARFAWHEQGRELVQDARLADSDLQSVIEETIRSQLTSLGFRFNDNVSEADLLLAYTAATERNLSDEELLRRFGLAPGYPAPEEDAIAYERGALVLYLVDPSNGLLVWRCAAQTLVDFEAQPEVRRQRIKAGIASMLDTLPVAGH